MNEFVGKKIGEVMAFCAVGIDTLQKGSAFAEVIGNEATTAAVAKLQEQHDALATLAGDQAETAMAKANATGEKLKGMREAYIGDQWDNAVEIMEWQGFFEGAAVVHCSLVAGAAEALELDELQGLAEDAQAFHQAALDQITAQLRATGAQRATA